MIKEEIDEQKPVEIQATYITKTGRKLCAMCVVTQELLAAKNGPEIVCRDLRREADYVIENIPPPTLKNKKRGKKKRLAA